MNYSPSLWVPRPLLVSPIHMALCLAYAGMLCWLLPRFFVWDANAFTGLLLLPLSCSVKRGELSLRYLLPAMLSLLLACCLPVRTLFFIALLLGLLLFVENAWGRVKGTALLMVLLVSPVFGHLTHLVEFPVRLWLSDRAAAFLSSAGLPAQAAGNQLLLGNEEFSVDPACAGLNMLAASLIMGLVVTAQYQQQLRRRLPWIGPLAITAGIVLLNVLSNFFRILVLVIFRIEAGTWLHDVTGLTCLLLYVVLPSLIFLKPLIRKWGTEVGEQQAGAFGLPRKVRYPLLQSAVGLLLLFTATRLIKPDALAEPAAAFRLPGYQNSLLPGGILKLENRQALIYVKPTVFYAPEHDPTICWRGSGYRFTSIRQENISGHEVYTALLQKDRDKIYAAWWFDNGSLKTTSQLTWRWLAARKKSRFYLINVNAATPRALRQQAAQLLALHISPVNPQPVAPIHPSKNQFL